MSDSAAVSLWGRRIGVVTLDDDLPYARFQYDNEFQGARIEPSPLMMPVGNKEYFVS